jgi:hypothetical protein
MLLGGIRRLQAQDAAQNLSFVNRFGGELPFESRHRSLSFPHSSAQ